ncbi:hypothetical protein GBAR_LOCUS4179 [Geodia barretti]|uniref:Uncharacterized protein n=1 Tax=Geodia barretti TaxID=519541 RepID=A0AA35R5W7_GEOBA|nr:hypothetical protein GBAR_LOCUS4179 [Geodia barretti]
MYILYIESVPSSCGDELKILGSQTSKGCGDPPETPAPTAPETETDNTRPDVLPPLYDDINTLTREKKDKPLSMPMYHVLEGPTLVESAPETQEQESSATDIPLYSVVDKSKKKKKATVPADPVRDQEEEREEDMPDKQDT